MLPDEANVQKQKKRDEQLKKWREREQELLKNDGLDGIKSTRVRFPKGCVFLACCASGDIDEVRQHLKIGVNINTTNIDGLTALHQACIDANIEMVKFLVDNDADINAQDNEGWTPLHASVSVGNLEVCKYLIQKSARLDICNNDSDLPIDLCDSTNIQMKHFLEEEMKTQQIDPNYEKQKEELIMYEDAKAMNFCDKIHQKTGATPLHVSAAKGYTRVMRLLLQSGANVNAVDNDGWTPLHAAAHWEQEEACQILSEYGASFEVKNYSGQTPFDVCDNQMVNKLKAIQSTVKPLETVKNEVGSDDFDRNRDPKLEPRNRKFSDESNKSSIVRLTNEAKSSIGEWEKKQEKIVLSPIISSLKPAFDSFPINSETDTDTKSKASGQKPSWSEDKAKSQLETAKTLVNETKPKLFEVFYNEQSGEKISRWGNNSNDSPNLYGSSINSRFLPASSINEIIPSKDSNNSRIPLTEEQTAKLNADKDISRRFSSAPIASKDEQAELIRKQKAKLERHFRRSTQAVSYEDIKSAEATIKGSSQNPLSPTIPSPVSPAYSSDFESPGFATKPSQGVSSLSSLFGEKIAKPPANMPTSSSAYSQSNQRAQPSLTVTITNPALGSTAASSGPPQASFTQANAPNVAQATSMTGSFATSTVPTLVTASANESIEKDAIIANDIETDKLLNAIEKSKGFSDTYSTTAARRLRNRANPYGMTSLSINSGSSSGNEDSSILSPQTPQTPLTANENANFNPNSKKINKLIWNEEKLEVEYRDPDVKSELGAVLRSEESSPTQIASHGSRQTSRFGQNDGGINGGASNPSSFSSSNNSNLSGGSNCLNSILPSSNNRSNAKRSVSQVPTTERRPLPQMNAISINSNQNFVQNVSNMFNPSVSSASSSPSAKSSGEGKSNEKKDYQIAYETLKLENDNLNQIVKGLKKELEEQSKLISQASESTLDKKEKRAFDRKVSELEEEIKKMESLKQDNTRLKEENAALIRVISKLSK